MNISYYGEEYWLQRQLETDKNVDRRSSGASKVTNAVKDKHEVLEKKRLKKNCLRVDCRT